MNSGDAIDVKALNWVKSEIGEAMNQVRQALEIHVEAADPAKLDFIVTQIHQVAGTLNIVELFGAAMLAEEMEHLAQALKDERVKQKQDAFEVLTRGILQLPGYLEHLSHGHKDQPLVLMPLLNDLRAAGGQPLLSENALFTPDLSVKPAEKSAPPAPGDIRALTKKLRTVYQAALVGLIRGTDLPTQHKKLSFVLSQLDSACTNATVRQLLWIAHGVVESLIDKGLEAGVSIKSLLGQIDRQLKKIVDHGEDALQSAPPNDLIKNLLFYVARSNSQGARARELKQAFKLSELMPSDNELSQTQNDLLGMNAGVMDTVTAALKEDLLSVKETVDLFVRSKDHPLSELEPVIAKLRAVGDTLGILGMGKLRKAIKDQEVALKDVLDGKQGLNDDVVMGVAGALLFVESSLGDMSNTDGGAATSNDGTMMPEAEYRNLVALTMREAKAVLTRVKDAVMQFAAKTDDYSLLESVPDLINDIRGALTVVGHERAGELLQLAGQFVSRDVLAQRMPMSQDKLDTLADSITGVEYFLESVDDDPVGAQYSLDVARESLARLGHFVPDVAAEPAAKPVATAEPVMDAPEIIDAAPVAAAPEEPAPEPEIIELAAAPAEISAMPEPETAHTPPAAQNIAPAAPAPVVRPPEVDPEVREIFLEEATEECQNIATQLALWKRNNENEEALRTLRRSFHTIKGSGRIVGALEIGEFAWAVENMLNRVLDHTIEISPTVFTVLEQANELLPQLVEELRAEQSGGVATQPLIEFAQRVAKGEAVDANAAPATEAPVEAAEDIIADSAPQTPPTRVIDAVLAEIFSNETRTHIAAIGNFIERCTTADPACPIDDELIRALHTLHGSAHMANIEEIATVSDALEKWAKLLQENHSTAIDYVLTMLSDAVEFLNAVLQDLSDAHSNAARKDELLSRIAILHNKAIATQNERLNAAPETPVATHPEIDAELVNVFLIEAADLVGHSLSETLVWESVPEQAEYADEIRRRFNTLQGGARIANLTAVASACGATAALLTQALDNPALRSGELVRLVRSALNWLADALDLIRAQTPVEMPYQLIEHLESYVAAMSILAPSEPEPAPVTESDHDNELTAIFLDEAAEILRAMEDVLQRWMDGSADAGIVADMQRALHTLKGGARMARVNAIGDLSHEIETLVQRIADGTSPDNAAARNLIQATHDWISIAVDQLRGGVMPDAATELLAQIEAFYHTPAEQEEITITAVAEPTPEMPSEEPEVVHVMESQVIPFPRAAEPAPAETEHAASEYDDELVDVFLEEATEITGSIDELVAQWANDTGNKEIVAKLQRALHTIKGGARMAKATAIGDLSHSIESILEGISEGRVKANAKLVDLMHSAYDWLTGALEKVRDKLHVEPATALIHQIEVAVGLRAASDVTEVAAEKTAEAPAAESGAIAAMMEAVRAMPARADVEEEVPALQARAKVAEEQVRVGMGLLDQVVNNAGEIAIYRSRIELQHNSIRFNLVEHAQTVNRLREQLRKFEIEAETQILFRYEKTGVSDTEEFDPLELDRFSNMQQLSRSLVESVGDLSSIQKLLENLTRESEILLLQQSRVTSTLQDGLMRTRLVPFASVVPRLRRIVRQTSKELGKNVELIVAGAEGEMDRSVLNRLTPALEHMLRNAVDHGIETPDKRRKAGKEGGGSVTLRFWREGPEIVLTIADDGAGMDLKAIRKKAIEKGLMENNSDLGPNEIMQFVLEAGFSTATKVTQISGRGVGMDVVNNEIRQLNGTLKIDTAKGKGTTFMVRLPLTVSVNQALIVHAGEQTYALPLSSIDGVVRIGREDLDKLHKDEHLPYEYAGMSYKFFHLGTVLNVSQPALPDQGIKIPLILARAGDHRVALQVEAIAARQEVVIKSVGPQMSTVTGISGATILNDGGVALILDLASLIRAGIAHGKRASETPVAARVSTVMIVDDSITVRKVTDRLMKRHGFETLMAKDGMDALAQLQEHIPDVMLLDIEMPRMDGYELATAMRNDERLKRIPIIMITSRTGDKHRERAMAIGVNMYMGKPFQDNELLENVNKLLNERR